MSTFNKQKTKWIFERAFIGSNSYVLDFLRKLLRILNMLVSLPLVVLTESTFDLVTISGNPGMKRCLVHTKSSKRILSIHKNTLKGFHVLDMRIDRSICTPNFKRVVSIVRQSLSQGYYSIDRMAEIYDFNFQKSLVEDFDFFASSDGSTPLSRSMCHIFKIFKKSTFRIVTHADGPKLDKNFTYNFLTENFKGEIAEGWIRISGSPWEEKGLTTKSDDMIGVIGEPSGIRLLGIEYWMLMLAYKLQKDGLRLKIRLHPQSYIFSNYLIKKILNIETSENEDERCFISSCRCLLSSYRSTILDLAISSGVKVILDSGSSQWNFKKKRTGVELADLKGNYAKIRKLINGKVGYNFPTQPGANPDPSIKDVVL